MTPERPSYLPPHRLPAQLDALSVARAAAGLCAPPCLRLRRRSLWVLGNRAALSRDPTWQALFDDAENRGLLVPDASAAALFPVEAPQAGRKKAFGAIPVVPGAAVGGGIGNGGLGVGVGPAPTPPQPLLLFAGAPQQGAAAAGAAAAQQAAAAPPGGGAPAPAGQQGAMLAPPVPPPPPQAQVQQQLQEQAALAVAAVAAGAAAAPTTAAAPPVDWGELF